ncbi:type II secretion system F family protein [Castellaniella daejeonensis]|uniref:Type II secretion system F family protein n=1 Tax=Castellaniella daejeonensis TaxID=659013 RepID=A0ABN0U3M8_9BURK
MNALIPALAAAALLLLALGIVLWQRAAHGARRQASAQYMARQLQKYGAPGPAVTERAGGLEAWHGNPTGWNNFLLRAGIRPTRHFYITLALRVLALPIALLVLMNATAAAAALVLLIPLNLLFIWLRVSRRHRRIIQQLPDFLESVVRMMTVGNSLGAAFQNASDRTEEPLRGILGQARRAGSVGVELDVALRQTARQYGIYELYLVAAIVGVAIRVGGRTDHVLERMSAFMRDLTQARNELVALSAETRLSAWILALLPLGLGALIIITNDVLIVGMWADPVGRKLLLGAFVLQVLGSFWLYRLSRLE